MFARTIIFSYPCSFEISVYCRKYYVEFCDKDEWPVRLMTIHREMNHYRDSRTVAREITRMSLKKAIILKKLPDEKNILAGIEYVGRRREMKSSFCLMDYCKFLFSNRIFLFFSFLFFSSLLFSSLFFSFLPPPPPVIILWFQGLNVFYYKLEKINFFFFFFLSSSF